MKRETNFSSDETYMLIECIGQNIKILENKRTDYVSNGTKKKAWKKIEEIFEKDPNCHNRSSQNLEAKWKSLKKVKYLISTIY